MSVQPTIFKLLRDHWGYNEFRPKQEAIISAILEGIDVAVVMPTGGGKSLCYQLPAVVLGDAVVLGNAAALGKTTLVVSPLLSLMQDQVAQLKESGIAAASLNSGIAPAEQRSIMEAARRGEYKLLYVSPERLAREDTLNWLRRIPLSFFAIDEAHCISEWGHEFRPEYRQLSRLRTEFPDLPIAAFTASATRRVRHDILAQLHLRSPRTFISSFFRSNLRYTVRACKPGEQERLLLRILSHHSDENVIVYAPTIARVEETVAFLASNGIAAVPYHGKMESEERRRNQARWMSDEVPVLVGTVAFGMGINKPGVRAVVHLSLPRSVEQYYQEAGRAGRDGLPADCILLWRKQDAGLLAHFIGEISDGAERQRAWDRYRGIRDFAEGEQCRNRRICQYFGETPKWTTCGACDICVGQPDWLGADSKPATLAVDRPPVKPTQVANVDPQLIQHMKAWRRAAAAARGVPAFVILHDTSLTDLCRKRPKSREELMEVHGFGRTKTEFLGPQVLAALAEFEAGSVD